MKMWTGVAATLVACALLGTAHSQAAITAGDLVIIGYNASGTDEFRVVYLGAANSGDTVNFTDNGWTSAGAFRTGEGTLTYTVQAGGISAGTTVNWLNLQSIAGTGWSSNNPSNFAFNASGDSLIAYTGTLASPTLVYALQQTAAWDASATSASTSAEPTSANSGTLASRVTTNAFGSSNGYYSGSLTSGTKTLLQVATANATNWTSSSSALSSSNWDSSFTVGSSSDLFWDSNTTTAGTGGAGTWNATTNNNFKSAASDTATYFRWVNSSAGNDHTAVFAGTAGLVSVAAGGVTASGLRFDIDGYTVQNNTITLMGTTPTLTVTNGSDTATISSALAGSTGLTKAGAGTAILSSSTNSYTGATSIREGKLLVSGSIAGTTMTVAPTAAVTATLASSGATNSFAPTATSGNAVSIGGGVDGSTARLAPGDVGTVGTMKFTLAGTAKLAFAAHSELNFDISGATSDTVSFATAGDWLTGSGTAVLALSGLTLADYDNTYTVFHNVSTAGFTFADITGFDSGFTPILSQSGNDYTLSFQVVPEPSCLLSLAFGTTALMTFRRFRRTLRSGFTA